MIKFISSEEYAKLTGDIDYWKARALQEEKMKIFLRNKYNNEYSKSHRYYEEYIDSERENEELKRKIKELEKEKVIKAINNEHHCDNSCFAEHVLSAIQRDYNYTSKKFDFIGYWYEKLSKEYPWLKCLYVIGGKIYFK